MQAPELPRDWTKNERRLLMDEIHERTSQLLFSPENSADVFRKLKIGLSLIYMIGAEEPDFLNLPALRDKMILDLATLFNSEDSEAAFKKLGSR